MRKALKLVPRPEEQFVERYQRLHAWALAVTSGNGDQADDLVHDAFIQFTLRRVELATVENTDAYLKRMLRNMFVSRLRRTSNLLQLPESIADYDSAELGLRIVDPQTQMQIGDELRRICRYTSERKETSRAASVLIMRFFHGYYLNEIGQVLRSPMDSIYSFLKMARREAKLYLDDPATMKFVVNAPAELADPKAEQNPIRLLTELRNTIFSSRRGACILRERLHELYAEGGTEKLDCEGIAHLVSCPICLDEVNEMLDLPLLVERYPTDTLGDSDDDQRDQGDRGEGPTRGGPGDGGAGVSSSTVLKRKHGRRFKEVFDHRPQELRISVNGFVLGSQKVGQELNEQTISVNIDERIGFVEVFSEQGVRLLFCDVEEPADGDIEQRAEARLSDGRRVELSLDFRSTWPTLHVLYIDPALAPEGSSPTVRDGVQSPTSNVHSPLSREQDSANERQKLLRGLRRRWSDFGLWTWDFGLLLRPATVTALFALILIAAAVFLYRRTPGPPMAADLLARAKVAEEAQSARTDQVLHRTISLEAKNLAGELVARQRIEVWHSGERRITARRLYDDRGALIAGDWRRADGVQTLYHHGARPQIKSVPETQGAVAASLNFENAWHFLPSAKDFTSLVGRADNARVEEHASEYLISYSREGSGGEADGVLKVALVLSRTDLHATEQSFTLRKSNEVREYRMVEASFERRPPSTVAPSVFEPDAELLSDTGTRGHGDTEREMVAASPSVRVPASPVIATPELEVEVLRLLNQAGADMGEQVSVTRTPEGLLQVLGLTQTDKRKRELLSALSSLAGNPAVRLDIQTLDEALARRPKDQVSSSSITVETTQPSSNTLPIDQELRHYFARRNVSEAQTDEAIRQFGDRTLRRSLQVLMHAAALKSLAQRFSQEELRTLDADAKAKWLLLIRRHAQGLQQESAVLRREVAPLFPAVSAQNDSETIEIQSDADLARAVQRLFGICSENDRAIRLAFSVSPESSSDYAIKSAQFWRSLQNAEALAATVSQYHAK